MLKKRDPISPPQPTTFIGRETELAEIRHLLLQEPGCRLLTIVGPGGMGKTRLSIEAARVQVDHFQGGVCFVPFAPIKDVASIVSTMIDALNIAFHGSGDPKDYLLSHLSKKMMLLVLDNFEHLLDGADLLSEIVTAAPQVQLLVTSRERLNLQEEWGFDLEGLQIFSSDEATLASLNHNSAAQLFLQSAQRAKATFTPTDKDVPHLIDICQTVGGMPLGLELAASWIRLMSCQEIAQEIEKNLDFLSASTRNLPERHRSLRAVFDHSWQLLSGEEQAVFRKLSVFRGGCTRKAAETVAGASLMLLSTLVDKSLVRRTQQGRYEIHELLRQFGEEALRNLPSEQTAIREKHSHFYLAWLQQKTAGLKADQQETTLNEIAGDIDNIQLAWQQALSSLKVKAIGQAVECLILYNEYRGRFRDGAHEFQRAVEAFSLTNVTSSDQQTTMMQKERQIVLRQLHIGQGWCCVRLGLRDQGQSLFQEGLRLIRQVSDAPLEILALNLIWVGMDDSWGKGVVLMAQGMSVTEQEIEPPAKAQAMLETAVTLLRTIGERRMMTYGLNHLGIFAEANGDYDQAKQYYLEVLQIREDIRDQVDIAYSYGWLSAWAISVGDYNQAEVWALKFIDLHRNLGHLFVVSEGLNKLGTLSRLKGAYHQEALANARETGMSTAIASSLTCLGQVAYDRSDFKQAEQHFKDSLTILQDQQDKGVMVFTLCRLGYLATAYHPKRSAEASIYFKDALQLGLDIQKIPICLDILAGIAELLYQSGKITQAIELLALVNHHPASQYEVKEKADARLKAFRADLPSQVADAAIIRGQKRDWQAVATEMLALLSTWSREAAKEFSAKPNESLDLPSLDTSINRNQRFIQETLIATGGMGEVYQGRDTETGQRVAIKRLKPDLVAENPDTIKRLIREGEALRRLNHPNIVQILAMIEDEAQPLIVMEYVSGGSLRDWLEHEAQPPLDRVLDLSLELADALTRAHHLGILHRDIKPANILLAEDGSPRLTDFGVAHLSGQDTRLTQAGSILGTIAYLSPEACMGEALDSRSDIWSFGALLFGMLAGQPLFEKIHFAATVAAILSDPIPDLATLRSDLPLTLVELIKRMLIKDRTLRINSIRQVAAELEAVKRERY